MRVGQKVRVRWDGCEGTILELVARDALLRMDEPDEDGVTEYHESLSEIEPLQESRQTATDFDGGFGIGGLGRFEETPPTPTAAQIRGEQRHIGRRCARCRHTEGGGAMFTTDPDRRVCDDCF